MKASGKVLAGDVKTVARLMTDLENKAPGAIEKLDSLYPYTGRAHIVGITGAPGAGKSTLINALTTNLRQKDMTIGILAIDPTSPFSGGAVLGDRIRMQEHGTDPGVFIRSLATRGGTGGLSRAALSMVHVLDVMGKDIIMVETVGIGQAEIEITKISDTSVLVLVPGMGDTIQLMKAGILEAADIFVINKANQDGAEALKVELEAMMSSKHNPPIVLTEAILNQGTEELAEDILKHRQILISSGELEKRRRQRAKHELMAAIESSLRSLIETGMDKDLERLTDDLVQGKTSPSSAAQELINLSMKQLK